MDRPLNRFLYVTGMPARLTTLACGLALVLLVGCSGGDSGSENGAGVAPAPASDAVPAPGTPDPTTAPPAKVLTEGMTLPEDVDFPAEAPASDSGQPKGMHLPDDLQPSASAPALKGAQAVRLVSATSRSAASDDFRTDIRYAAWGKVESEIRNTGKVTVVDLWSLACAPCLREYPHLVALQNKYPERVQAVGVNLDYDGREKYPAQSYQPRVKEFLTAVGAGFPNYLSETPSEEVFAAVEIGSLPAVLVFDETGKLAGRFTANAETGAFGYQQDILPLVAKLLAK